MKPVPVLFHLGPLTIHTYGIGLAVTFLAAYAYFARRLRRAGYPTDWLEGTFVWIVVAAVVGARVVHVLANIGVYIAHPATIPAVWQGGLSSFGGLAFGVPTGFWLARRRCPQLSGLVAADLVAPVLIAAWGLGRLLGPQLMIRGGGHPTTAWYGMYYAGEVGKRVPVPLFQAAMCAVIFAVVIWVERWRADRAGLGGLVMTLAVGLWGASRFIDERLWLSYGHPGDLAVEGIAITMAVVGLGASAWLLLRARLRGWRSAGGSPPAVKDQSPEAAGLPPISA